MSPPKSTGSSPANNGTVGVKFDPQIDFSFSKTSRKTVAAHNHTISAKEECKDFSLEELRLADYNNGHGPPSVDTSGSSATTSTCPLQRLPRSDEKKHVSFLNFLHGPGIELHVGTSTPEHDSTEESTSNTWSLPQRLISHYSPFLEAACLLVAKERRENQIKLPDDDPAVFAFFVEWLYYGEYGIAPLSLPFRVGKDDVNVHVKCWILGDKLLCSEFKNYAMSRLYDQHNAKLFGRPVSTVDVQYACDNSAEDSKLRKLYVDFVATNFGKLGRVQGTVDEWDSVLTSYADMRRLLLQSFRLEAAERSFVKPKDCYLEEHDAPPS